MIFYGKSRKSVDSVFSECYNNACVMRPCWNWQTGTFEVRVSLTYGFKSRRPHQWKPSENGLNARFLAVLILPESHFGVYLVFIAAKTYEKEPTNTRAGNTAS